MKKVVSVLVIAIAIGILFWQQSLEKREVVFQVIAFMALFFGMARLSAKTPSKNQDKEEK